MDRFKKLKKEKSGKCLPNDKPVFITDVKDIKENMKIKEILRTVKMNSSMRLKAPPGSKIMNNNDFNDDDCFEESSATHDVSEPLSATNPDVVISKVEQEENDEDIQMDSELIITDECENVEVNGVVEKTDICNDLPTESISVETPVDSSQNESQNDIDKTDIHENVPNGEITEITLERKLSLDHTILCRREGLSQSELDLHSLRKAPLERKSSFFRKTMDSFVKNTTEMFKMQRRSLERRVSLSVSLQSLNDKSLSTDYRDVPIHQVKNDLEDSKEDLQSTPQTPLERSSSSLSMEQHQPLELDVVLDASYAGSQPALNALSSPTLENIHSGSVHSLNEAYVKEMMLNSRAISMSSGLDSPLGRSHRKASRSNRVTWEASEGWTNYIRRIIQDEKNKEIQSCQSQQDISSIPERKLYSRKSDSKGRRLSYQRAVSGEDPVMPLRHEYSTLRKKQNIPELCERRILLTKLLMDYSRNDLPPILGFQKVRVSAELTSYILEGDLITHFDMSKSPEPEERRQTIIKELVKSEAEYIQNLLAMVDTVIAVAHALQRNGTMLNIDTQKLFANLPDLLNDSLNFWNLTFEPMVKDAAENNKLFNPELMFSGFLHINELLASYEDYVIVQKEIVQYNSEKKTDHDFSLYSSWCQNRPELKRLQISDYLAKPMQRLTKYELLLGRIADHTEPGPERSSLESMKHYAKAYARNINYAIRQKEELIKLEKLINMLEHHDTELKDDELEKLFKMYFSTNLKTPMMYCIPSHNRFIIHQINLCFRDGAKEIDARVIILTDMLLICRRFSKSLKPCKLLKPRIMLDKLLQIPKYVSKNSKDLAALAYIVVDDAGCSAYSFILSESPKEPQAAEILNEFHNKIIEAKLTYELIIWSAQNPNKPVSDADVSKIAESLNMKARSSSEQASIEMLACKTASATVYRRRNGDKPDTAEAMESTEIITGVSVRPPGPNQIGHIFHRTVSGETANKMSLTVPGPHIAPAAKKDEEQPPSSKSRRAVSLEPLKIPAEDSTSEGTPIITVKGPNDQDPEEELLIPTYTPSPTPSGEEYEKTKNNVCTLIYSLPHVTIEPSTPKTTPSPTPSSASEKLYQAHHELLERNSLQVIQSPQYLSPDHRGTSYPPPNPARSMQRSSALATGHPPLTRMDAVRSPSPVQPEEEAPTTQQPPQPDRERASSPKPGPSTDKFSKFISRLKFKIKKEDYRELETLDVAEPKGETSSAGSLKDDTFEAFKEAAANFKDMSDDIFCPACGHVIKFLEPNLNSEIFDLIDLSQGSMHETSDIIETDREDNYPKTSDQIEPEPPMEEEEQPKKEDDNGDNALSIKECPSRDIDTDSYTDPYKRKTNLYSCECTVCYLDIHGHVLYRRLSATQGDSDFDSFVYESSDSRASTPSTAVMEADDERSS